ncbi:terminase large subunit [Bacillus phage vB_BpsM-61]|nr:terminase large subunit [Bacillus phage vB_BpsM-61]
MKNIVDPSPNQIRALTNSNQPFNLWEGSIRSGKTFWSLIWLVTKMGSLPDGDGMLLGQTSETIDRNYLLDLLTIMDDPECPLTYNHVQRSHVDVYWHDEKGNPRERRMWIVGAKDKGAIKRIRGSTLMIAYIDELTMMPKVAFDELVGRLSLDESTLLATTNPDSPHHWVLKDYLEDDVKKYDWSRWSFIMDDNAALSEAYKERMKRQYSGLPSRYQRMILGRWVMADGLVYEVFDINKHVISRDKLPKQPPIKYHVSGDYGTKNPNVFGLFAEWKHPTASRDKKRLYVLVAELYHDGRKTGISKTTRQYLKDFRDFISHKRIATITLDPSASPLIAEFEQNGLMVTPADNSVMDGISVVANSLDNGTFLILDECTHTIEEFSLYVWDESAGLKGIDKPIKEHDHCMDMVRYFLKTHADETKRGKITGVSGW